MSVNERSVLLPSGGSPSAHVARYNVAHVVPAAASPASTTSGTPSVSVSVPLLPGPPPMVRQLSNRGQIGALFAPGSVLSSVVNLCTATLGAGCLALPWAMKQCGLALGIAMLIVAALSSVFTIRLLVRLYKLEDHTSFESLAMRAFGPWGTIATRLTLLIFCMGTAVASVMVVGDILQPIFSILFPQLSILHHKTTLLVLLTASVMLPLSFFRNISSLRVMSLLSTLGVFVLAAVFLYQGALALLSPSAPRHHVPSVPIRWFRFDSHVLLALPIIMFAYSCQANIFQILSAQNDQSRSTDFTVVNIAVGIETVIYVLIGAAGYALYGGDIDGNVLRNLDLSQPTHIAAQLCMGVSLCLSYPLCIYPARFTILDLLWPEDDDEDEAQRPQHAARSAVLTVMLVAFSLLCAIYIPSISELFALLGSTTGALIGFILPCGMYLRLGQDQQKQVNRRRMCMALLVLGIVVAVLTTTRSLQFAMDTPATKLLKEPQSASGGAAMETVAPAHAAR